jgi:hypothetical protein
MGGLTGFKTTYGVVAFGFSGFPISCIISFSMKTTSRLLMVFFLIGSHNLYPNSSLGLLR